MIKKVERIAIIITVDYELPGNGTGDIRKLIVEPTNRLHNILFHKGIRMTIFFEIEEYLVFKKYRTEITKALGYDPTLLIKEQIREMAIAGHEIGLHIHPQWIGARFDGKRFNLFPKNFSLYDLYKTEDEIYKYLESRKYELEKMIGGIDSNKNIICFRAGGHALRPEKLVFKALSSLGIRVDSSAVKDLYRIERYGTVDYRDVPYNKGCYRVNHNVGLSEPDGRIIELPVYARLRPEYKKITINRIKRKYLSDCCTINKLSNSYSTFSVPKTPLKILRSLLKKTPMKFDFCHMTAKEMLSFVYNSLNDKNDQMKSPLTMIGHSKEFFNDKQFIKFIDEIINKKQFKFVTVRDQIEAMEDRK